MTAPRVNAVRADYYDVYADAVLVAQAKHMTTNPEDGAQIWRWWSTGGSPLGDVSGRADSLAGCKAQIEAALAVSAANTEEGTS